MRTRSRNHLILRSRLCYGWKPVPEGQRAKARIVIAGFKDPHLAGPYERCARTGAYIIPPYPPMVVLPPGQAP